MCEVIKALRCALLKSFISVARIIIVFRVLCAAWMRVGSGWGV